MRGNMKKNFVLAALILGILINGWAIAFLELPFYREVLIIGALSILIMTVLHEKFVFLFAIAVALSYGVFLTVRTFTSQYPAEMQMLFMYAHLLLTAFLLQYWILMNLLKRIGYENDDLKHQVELLQKYDGVTKVLTHTEFDEQAKWLLKSSERNKEDTWFVKISINYPSRRILANLQEDLENLALQTIRHRFDLITSDAGVIFLLLKNTDFDGVDKVLDRYRDMSKSDLNLLAPPYHTVREKLIDADHLDRLMGRPL